MMTPSTWWPVLLALVLTWLIILAGYRAMLARAQSRFYTLLVIAVILGIGFFAPPSSERDAIFWALVLVGTTVYASVATRSA